ncbi:MAG: phytanoyl-CoA dioxygenase family protein [Ilumatobacteraceae bacterium]
MATDQLTQAIEQYREEGYAVIPNFIPESDVAELQRETKQLYEIGLEHPTTYRHGNLLFEILPERHFNKRYVVQAHWFAWISDYFERFRRRPEFLHLLEPLLERNVKQVAQQIHWKPPGADKTGYRFHQDFGFRETGANLGNVVADSVQVGLAIDESHHQNGCLRIIPRGHEHGYLGLSDDGAAIMSGLTPNEELQSVGLDPSTMIDIELNPGDAVIWGLLTVHGSLPNLSDSDRALMISSYVRAETSMRGEWAFRDGISTPLGSQPQLCKYEKLHERPEPHYIDSEWFL